MQKLLIASLIFSITVQLIAFEDVKKDLAHYENALHAAKAPSEQSLIYKELSLAFCKDQELDKAFQSFLTALDLLVDQKTHSLSAEEQALYDSALALYLSHDDPLAIAKQLIDQFETTALAHPDYAHLNLLMAAAHANLASYELFFNRLYAVYPVVKESFLSYKVQGILNLRLASHGKSQEERLFYKQRALVLLENALEKESRDLSLYKILITLAKESNDQILVASYLQKMSDSKVLIPRREIYPYVKEAVDLGKYEVGKNLIDIAKDVYQYSRSISVAEEYLNQKKVKG